MSDLLPGLIENVSSSKLILYFYDWAYLIISLMYPMLSKNALDTAKLFIHLRAGYPYVRAGPVTVTEAPYVRLWAWLQGFVRLYDV